MHEYLQRLGKYLKLLDIWLYLMLGYSQGGGV